VGYLQYSNNNVLTVVYSRGYTVGNCV
jgi:hypothetical protein